MKYLSLKIKIALAILIVVIGLAGVMVGTYLYTRDQQVEEAQDFSDELRDGLVRSCEQNGNPLRSVVSGILVEQVKQSRDLTLYEEFFPNVPRERLENIMQQRAAADVKRLSKLQPLDCEKLYPSKP